MSLEQEQFVLTSAAGPSFDHLVFVGERPDPSPRRPRADRADRSSGEVVRSAASAALAGVETLDPASAAFFRLACDRRGLDASRYRATVLRRRQGACLRALRAASLREAHGSLERDAGSADRVIEAVMIGVTAFFRDEPVFDALGPMLPGLARRRARLRVLSVGCSDGSEVYSVAILLAERGLLHKSTLWGLDCRNEAIAVASAGAYAAEAVGRLDPALRARHFGPAPGAGRPAVRVNEALRAACRWRVGDAFTLEGPADVDLLLCRNLAIYLRHEASRELWARLGARLRPGGVLMVGKAERPAGVAGLVRVGPCLYQKTEEA